MILWTWQKLLLGIFPFLFTSLLWIPFEARAKTAKTAEATKSDNTNASTPEKKSLNLKAIATATTTATPVSEKGKFLLQADRITKKEQTIHLEGNVQIIFDTYHFSAEEAFIYLDKKLVEGRGQVRFSGMEMEMGGEHLILNYETYLGVLSDGYLNGKKVFLKGRQIKKISPTKYLIRQGAYTRCSSCRADWSFHGSKVIVNTRKNIQIYGATLKLNALPVFYLPFVRFPLHVQKHTGFLTPSFNFSQKSGWVLEQDFFWNLSRSKDITFGLKHYELRGLKGLMEYRYVLAEKNYGNGNFALLRDRVFNKDYSESSFGSGDNKDPRWLAHYSHYNSRSRGRDIYRLQSYLVSDLHYARDFYDELPFHGISALESKASYTRNEKSMHFHIEKAHYFNLIQSDPLSRNKFAVHRMPEIQYTFYKRPLGQSSTFFRFDLNYVHFWGDGMNHSDIASKTIDGKKIYFLNNSCNEERFDSNLECILQKDNTFDSTDIARSGHRLLMNPQLSRDFVLLRGLHLFTSLDYHNAQYFFPEPMAPRAHRHWLDSNLKLHTRFHGIFGEKSIGTSRLKHEIIPSIRWKTIPWVEQSHDGFFARGPAEGKEKIPFFQRETITDSDIGSHYKLQFDYKDRLYGKNIYFFNLDNIFTLKTWKQGKPVYKQVARLHLSQSYNNHEKTINRKKDQNWSDINAVLETNWSQFGSYTHARYYSYYSVSDVFSRLRWMYKKNYLQLSMLYSYPLGESRFIPYSLRVEDYTLSANLHSRYIDLVGNITYDANFQKEGEVHRIKSWSYYLVLKPPNRCWSFFFKYEKITDGDINWKFNVNFVFGEASA